jgi:hypothetical protein
LVNSKFKIESRKSRKSRKGKKRTPLNSLSPLSPLRPLEKRRSKSNNIKRAYRGGNARLAKTEKPQFTERK